MATERSKDFTFLDPTRKQTLEVSPKPPNSPNHVHSPKNNEQKYQPFEGSPMKLREEDKDLFFNMINCKICGKSSDFHLLVRPCNCGGDDEYCHQECLYRETHSGDSSLCEKTSKAKMECFRCKVCKQAFPLNVETKINVKSTMGMEGRRRQLYCCSSALTLQLILFFACLGVHLRIKEGVTVELVFSLITLFSILPNILLIWHQFCHTKWRFVDKLRTNKKRMIYWVNLDWNWYQE